MANRYLKLIAVAMLPLFPLENFAQQFEFLPSFDSVSSNSFFYLAGKVGNNNLVIKTKSGDLPEVLVCDSAGRLIEQKKIPVVQLSTKTSMEFTVFILNI